MKSVRRSLALLFINLRIYPSVTICSVFFAAQCWFQVNGSLVYLASDVVSRHVCLAALSICESGFTFPETNFVSKVMESEQSCEVIEDHSK